MGESEKLSAEQRLERVKKAIEESNSLRLHKRFREGVETLREALQYQMQTDQIYYWLGNIYYDAEDLDRAETAYKQAIEINKQHANAYHNLSVVYKRKGNRFKFVEMLKKSKKIAILKPFMGH